MELGGSYGSRRPAAGTLIERSASFSRDLSWLADNVNMIAALAINEMLLWRWDSGEARLARRAAENLGSRARRPLQPPQSPRSASAVLHSADPEADRAVAALAPSQLRTRGLNAMVGARPGGLDGARCSDPRGRGGSIPARCSPTSRGRSELGWVLDEARQRRVLALPPSAFDDDRANWGLVRAQLYRLRGDGAGRGLRRLGPDRLREQIQAAPEDAQRHALLGWPRLRGPKEDAIRAGERGVELAPISRDAYAGPYVQHQLARIYMLVGEPDKAMDQLEPLLRAPYDLSPGISHGPDVRSAAEQPAVPEAGRGDGLNPPGVPPPSHPGKSEGTIMVAGDSAERSRPWSPSPVPNA